MSVRFDFKAISLKHVQFGRTSVARPIRPPPNRIKSE